MTNNERLNYNLRMKLSRIMSNPLAPKERRQLAEDYYTGAGACDLETIRAFAEKYGYSKPTTLTTWRRNSQSQ